MAEEQRTDRIIIMVTPSLHERIRREAFEARKTLSTYVYDRLIEMYAEGEGDSFFASGGTLNGQNGTR